MFIENLCQQGFPDKLAQIINARAKTSTTSLRHGLTGSISNMSMENLTNSSQQATVNTSFSMNDASVIVMETNKTTSDERVELKSSCETGNKEANQMSNETESVSSREVVNSEREIDKNQHNETRDLTSVHLTESNVTQGMISDRFGILNILKKENF